MFYAKWKYSLTNAEAHTRTKRNEQLYNDDVWKMLRGVKQTSLKQKLIEGINSFIETD